MSVEASAPSETGRRSVSIPSWGWTLLSFAIVFGAWEVAGRVPISLAFPPFSAVAAALVRLIASGELLRAYGETIPPLVVGVLAAAVVGIALGVSMGLMRVLEFAFYPPLVIMQTAPVAAIIPLITFIYGIGDLAKVVAVMILAVPLTALNAFAGIRNADARLIEMARAFQGSTRQVVTKIIVPDASGMIFAGLRLGVSGGFIGIVLAELLITPTGIGDTISYYRSVAKYAEMYAAIVSIIALATVTLALIETAERRLFGKTRR
ncbi:ABC transporter permease [Acuticoccus mangrovi]|uniref:ABC transporter permease subunit n=1 Tax=Acuticoccus mangrovi TaxID=2796142 RepID=A0A934IM53_9HYPH|nr:ABC transporter permease subunit [Acuticoccus mangrovi]